RDAGTSSMIKSDMNRSAVGSADADSAAMDVAVQRRPVPAWVCSAVLHALLVVTISLGSTTTAPQSTPGTAGGQDRSGQIALVDVQRSEPAYMFQASASAAASSSAATSAAATPQRSAAALPGPAALAEAADIGLPTADATDAAASGSSSGLPSASG